MYRVLAGFWGAWPALWVGRGGPDLAPPTIYGAPRAHGPSKTARFTMFCGGDPAKTRVSARFGAEITRFTWFSKGDLVKTRVLAGFSLEISEFTRVWARFRAWPRNVENPVIKITSAMPNRRMYRVLRG